MSVFQYLFDGSGFWHWVLCKSYYRSCPVAGAGTGQPLF